MRAGLNVEFEHIEVISHPIQNVYEVLRDHTADLAPYLPQVTSIKELSREEESPGVIRVLNHWQAHDRSAPAAVRPFVSKKMLAWHDHARWMDAEHQVEWRLETTYLARLFECGGVNAVESHGDGNSQFRLHGTLIVYPERVPGVPRILAKRLRSKIEDWMIQMITPNLAELPRAVQQFLDRRA